MAADRQIDIQITTTADTQGLENAAKAVEEVKEQTEELTEEQKQFLGPEMVARAAEAARAIEEVAEATEAVAESSEGAVEGIEGVTEAVEGVGDDAGDALDEVNDSLEELEENTNDASDGGGALASKFEELGGVMGIATGALGFVSASIGAYIATNEEAQDAIERFGKAWLQVMADVGESAGAELLVKGINLVTEALGGETAAMEEARQAAMDHDAALAASEKASAKLKERLAEEADAWDKVKDAINAKDSAARAESRREVERTDADLADELATIDADGEMTEVEKIRARRQAEVDAEERKLAIREQDRNESVAKAQEMADTDARAYLDTDKQIREAEARVDAARMLGRRQMTEAAIEADKEKLRVLEEEQKQADIAAADPNNTAMPDTEQYARRQRGRETIQKRIARNEEYMSQTDDYARTAAQEGVRPFMGEDDPELTRVNALQDELTRRGEQLEKVSQELETLKSESLKDSIQDNELTQRRIERGDAAANRGAQGAEKQEQIKERDQAGKEADAATNELVTGVNELAKAANANSEAGKAAKAKLEEAAKALSDGATNSEMDQVGNVLQQFSTTSDQTAQRLIKVVETALAKAKETTDRLSKLEAMVNELQ